MIIESIVGGILGALIVNVLKVVWRKRRQRALSPADIEIQEALTEGVLTYDDLIDIGIDPDGFNTMGVEEQKAMLLANPNGPDAVQRAAARAGLVLANMDLHTASGVSIRGSITLEGEGSFLKVDADGGVEIRAGRGTD